MFASDAAASYEVALAIWRELESYYLAQQGNYGALSRVLRRQAELAELIRAKDRYYPSYFAVAYVGASFPKQLRGGMFVYRAKTLERTSDFEAGLQTKWPGMRKVPFNVRELVPLLAQAQAAASQPQPPGGELDYRMSITTVQPAALHDQARWDADFPLLGGGVGVGGAGAMSLQGRELAVDISETGSAEDAIPPALMPQLEETPPPAMRGEGFVFPLPQAGLGAGCATPAPPTPASMIMPHESTPRLLRRVRAGRENARVRVFVSLRPFKRKLPPGIASSDFLELWVTKTHIITEEAFPFAVRRSAAQRVVVTDFSPADQALSDLRSSTLRLLDEFESIEEVRERGQAAAIAAAAQQLSGLLSGLIDAAISGGTANFEGFFHEAFWNTYTDIADAVRSRGPTAVTDFQR
jgi:hypothetical protein